MIESECLGSADPAIRDQDVNGHFTGAAVRNDAARGTPTAWGTVRLPPAICGLPTSSRWPPDGGTGSYAGQNSMGGLDAGRSQVWTQVVGRVSTLRFEFRCDVRLKCQNETRFSQAVSPSSTTLI